jgi:hypothetical protein
MPFSSFGGGSGTVDWTNVGAIVLEVDGRNVDSLDMSIDWITVGVPTSVDIASFDASSTGSAVQLTWETASELDNLGFNAYRAEAADGPRTKLNANLIASQAPGSPTGAIYQFTDETAQAGTTYYYWLEAVDVYGASQEYGPVSASLSPLQRLLPARPRPIASPPILRTR